jgi:hypothetical protein
MMLSRGLRHEVVFAAQKSRFPVVVQLSGSSLRAVPI